MPAELAHSGVHYQTEIAGCDWPIKDGACTSSCLPSCQPSAGIEGDKAVGRATSIDGHGSTHCAWRRLDSRLAAQGTPAPPWFPWFPLLVNPFGQLGHVEPIHAPNPTSILVVHQYKYRPACVGTVPHSFPPTTPNVKRSIPASTP